MLRVVNAPEHRNLSPRQIVPRLADRGIYLASEATIYRVLRAEGQLALRGRAQPRRRLARWSGRTRNWELIARVALTPEREEAPRRSIDRAAA